MDGLNRISVTITALTALVIVLFSAGAFCLLSGVIGKDFGVKRPEASTSPNASGVKAASKPRTGPEGIYPPAHIDSGDKAAALVELIKDFGKAGAGEGRTAGKGHAAALSDMEGLKRKIALESGDYSKAVEELDSMLTRVPMHPGTLGLIAWSEEARKKMDGEIVDRHLRKGMGYFFADDMESAIMLWDAVLKIDPGNKEAADYKKRAQAVLDTLKELRERQEPEKKPL